LEEEVNLDTKLESDNESYVMQFYRIYIYKKPPATYLNPTHPNEELAIKASVP
jgi:hypothetical protein